MFALHVCIAFLYKKINIYTITINRFWRWQFQSYIIARKNVKIDLLFFTDDNNTHTQPNPTICEKWKKVL